jgi:surface antigen
MRSRRLFMMTPLFGLAACATPIASNAETPSGLPELSQDAQLRRYLAMQYALEHNLSGQSTGWELSSQVRGAVVPLETVLSRTDGWCRDYQEIIGDGARRYRLVGIACRKPGPHWLVLGIRPYAERS